MDTTILIVDDDVDYQFMVGSMLRRRGYEVLSLLQGKPADAVCMASRCDIVLLDIELPGINGVELLLILRASAGTSKVPVILVSGHNNGDELFLRSQANAFIQKPFSLATLLSKIQELLSSPVKQLADQ